MFCSFARVVALLLIGIFGKQDDALTTVSITLAAAIRVATGFGSIAPRVTGWMREVAVILGAICATAVVFLAGADCAIWQRTASHTPRIETDGGAKYTHMVPLRALAIGIAAWSQDQSRVVILPLDKVAAVVPE